MLYADVTLEPGAAIPVDAAHEERALYTVSGEVEIAGERFAPRDSSWCCAPAM